jgi:hypothetical protein
MDEAAESGKELSHCAHGSGMDGWMALLFKCGSAATHLLGLWVRILLGSPVIIIYKDYIYASYCHMIQITIACILYKTE